VDGAYVGRRARDGTDVRLPAVLHDADLSDAAARIDAFFSSLLALSQEGGVDVTPAAKAEALLRLAKSTSSQAERASALARAREIVARHRLRVMPDGRVAEIPAAPATVEDTWDRFARRAKRFLVAIVEVSQETREEARRPTPTPASWDLRDTAPAVPSPARRTRPRRRRR